MTATPSQQRETLAALTAQVRCDLEQHHPDCDVTDETISIVLELGGPRMKAAALREAADQARGGWGGCLCACPDEAATWLHDRADRIEAGD